MASIGYAFPGVDITQLNKFKEMMKAKKKVAPEPPKIKVNQITPEGVISITFDQEMLAPNDTSIMNYGKVFQFSTISQLDGSRMEATRYEKDSKKKKKKSRKKRRRDLVETEEEDIWAFGDDPKDDKSQDLKFNWDVVAHDPREIKIQVDFETPEQISRGG